MSLLIIIRGLPGSGKTTFARGFNATLIEADMFFEKDGIYTFDSKKLGEAHNWCFTRTRQLLSEGYDVVVANTFTTLKEMRPYLFMGHNYNVYKCVGNFGSIHNVPQSTIHKMQDRWENYAGEIEVKC